ncbi:MAG TPA: polysaccharide biosynthesis C-terminal domain-containing protein, partial [Anaerolineae bacterium]
RPLVLAALRLKLLLSLPVALLLLIFTADWPGVLRLSLLSLGLTLLAQTYLEFVAYVFRGQQNLTVEAFLLASARLLTAAIGGVVLWLGGGLPGLALSHLVSTGLLVAWSLWLLQQSGWLERAAGADGTTSPRRPGFDVAYPYHDLLRQALPIGVSIFLSIAYTRLAILLLQHLLGEIAVARFSAAYRLVEPAQIVPASLLAAAFPAFSYALHHGPAEARRLGTRVSLLLALLGGSVAITFWLAAAWLIPLLYGDHFASSVPVLQVLGLSSLPAFVNYSLTHYLIARGQQVTIGLFTAVMLLLHAALSWQLIPALGEIGPALSIVVAECVLLICCLLTLATTRPKTGTGHPHA